jgi:chorismate dehydratase
MNDARTTHEPFAQPGVHDYRVGCVSYLNSKPLIAGLTATHPSVHVRYDVPSKLLDDLLADKVDIALCPVVDYFRSPELLKVVPVGGICSKGHTLTVCLFSRTPIEQLTEIHADTDSHTSVNLLRVIMAKRYKQNVTIVPYNTRHAEPLTPNAMLLIGDKVVTDSPKAVEYPYQLDLGQAWAALTGLPFMFATWLAKQDTSLGDLPQWMSENLKRNQPRRSELASEFANQHGWPEALAYEYLTENLHYEVGPKELKAMQLFATHLHELKLLETLRPLKCHP